ncbi:MAG: hypothetical protein ABSB74_20945 [Tepidisphaeraceae bacterium]
MFSELCGGEGSGIQIGGGQAVKLVIQLLDLPLDMSFGVFQKTASVLPFVFKPLNQPVRSVIGKRYRSQNTGDLFGGLLLPQVRLRAILFHPLGASQVIVPFLGFHGDAAAAFGAVKQATVDVRLEPHSVGFAPPLHHLLDFVKKFLGDERLMRPLVHFAVEYKDAVIEGIAQKVLESKGDHPPVVHASQSLRCDDVSKAFQGVVACGVEFKGHLDQGSFHRVNDNRPQLRLVEVSFSTAFSARSLALSARLAHSVPR